MSTTLTSLLADACTREGAVLIDRERIVSAASLQLESRRVARGLVELGVKRGDRVAIWLPNVAAWPACFFACAQLGAIAVALNTRFRSAEIGDILQRSGAKVLVLWPRFRDIGFDAILDEVDAAALKQLEAIVTYHEDDETASVGTLRGRRSISYRAFAANEPYDEDRSRGEDGCVIFTTSGTTRAPKFVLHSQAVIARHANDIARAFGFTASDAAVLVAVPLCGVFGFCAALSTLAAGRRLITLPSFDARTAVATIRTHAVTHMLAVGDMVAQLLRTTAEERPFPTLRTVIGARHGQAAPAETRGLRLVGVYGSSELQAMLSRQSGDARPEERELGGGVLVAPEGRVRARDPQNGAIVSHGERGELEFALPSCMLGYYGNPEATAAAFTADGYLRSGDLGYTVSDREYIFLARMGDALRLSGFLVNPLEIEAIIDEHPGIRTSQVVGVETARGLRAVAFVIPSAPGPFDEQALIAYCARRIANYKVPQRIFAIDAFPVTPSANGNKVQKARLRELARAAMGIED